MDAEAVDDAFRKRWPSPPPFGNPVSTVGTSLSYSISGQMVGEESLASPSIGTSQSRTNRECTQGISSSWCFYVGVHLIRFCWNLAGIQVVFVALGEIYPAIYPSCQRE